MQRSFWDGCSEAHPSEFAGHHERRRRMGMLRGVSLVRALSKWLELSSSTV